jgi:hypothetical protein
LSSFPFGLGKPTFSYLLNGSWRILKCKLLTCIISLKMMKFLENPKDYIWRNTKIYGSIWVRKRSLKFFKKFWTFLTIFQRTSSMFQAFTTIIIRLWIPDSLALKFYTSCKSIKLALFSPLRIKSKIKSRKPRKMESFLIRNTTF